MSWKKTTAIVTLSLVWASFGLASRALADNPASSADDLVAKHLDSIASAKVRAETRTRLAQGPVQFKILVGGAGVLEGKAVLVSEGKKFQFMMKLPNNEYRGEQFIFDGDQDKVAFATARQNRSALGNFVFVQDMVIREGLLGGALSTAWPLLSLDERKPKLSFEGLKKIDGEEVYELRYQPRKKTDLDIRLYFDSQTYRHVETTYSYSVSLGFANLPASGGIAATPGSLDSGPGTVTMGANAETAAARQQPTRYLLREKFSDFKTVDGVTLPTHYDVQFTQELQSGRTTVSDWDLQGLELKNNVPLDPRNFEVK